MNIGNQMNIIRYIIHRPVAVTMIVIALVVLGVVAAVRLPVSLLPDVDVPQVTVQISRPGASARQIDEQIVRPLRSRLAQLTGLKDMRTEARMDAATITLMFDPGSNVDLIFIDVNEKVDMAMGSLPKDLDRPKVVKAGVADIPAFFIDVMVKDAQAGVPSPGSADMGRFAELSDFARNVVRKRIEQLPQTAMVDISGTVGQEIRIIPDYDRLRSMGVGVDEIEKALADNDIQIEALAVTDGRYRYNIHFDSQMLTRDDIADIRINHEGRLFRLADLCRVERRAGVRHGRVRHGGRNAITMAVVKQSDARMDDLKAGIERTIADMRRQHPDVDFAITRDQTRLLAYSIASLEGNLAVSAVLTSVVLLLFLRSFRLALIVALTIPLSLIVTLLCFHQAGISLNVISLSGLILGVGMIVDNSIIVTDNIVQKKATGLGMADAVARGTSEVFTPMLSSVLTTCSVFLPLIFLSGIAGELFYDQSVGIATSLFSSLAVAMLVVPVFFYGMYRRRVLPQAAAGRMADGLLVRPYTAVLGAVMRHGRVVLALFLLSLPGLVGIAWLIDKQRMPELGYDDMQVAVSWNEGISEEESDRRINELTGAVADLTDVSSSLAGTQQFILSHTRNITASEAVAYLKCGTPERLAEAQRRMQRYADSAFARATLSFEPVGNPFDMVLNTGESALELRIQERDGGWPSVEMVQRTADAIRARFPDVHVPRVELDDNLMCRADIGRMAVYGVSYQMLLRKLREQAGANRVMEISDGDMAVPVIVGQGDGGTDRERMMQTTVTNAQKVEVPIRYLMTDSSVNDFKRLYASVEGEYYPICIDAGAAEVRSIMHYADSLSRTDGNMAVSYAGSYFSGRAMVKELAAVLAVALLLLFFVMAAQFESLVQPLIILSEIVLDCFVVLLILHLLGMSLNLMSMTGLVVMSGIVVNDSILKIDTINRLRRGGMPLLRAVITAGHERLRPIVMTSVTTILAVMPFLSRGDLGADMQYPLSLTLIVGMTVGTAVSLFFVPLLYYVVYKRKR